MLICPTCDVYIYSLTVGYLFGCMSINVPYIEHHLLESKSRRKNWTKKLNVHSDETAPQNRPRHFREFLWHHSNYAHSDASLSCGAPSFWRLLKDIVGTTPTSSPKKVSEMGKGEQLEGQPSINMGWCPPAPPSSKLVNKTPSKCRVNVSNSIVIA